MQHVDDALLVAYADDELTPSERGAVEAHLVSCAECRARVDEERALAQRAAAVLGLGAPDESTVPSFDDVLRRTERTDATSAATIAADRTRRRSLKPLALAATLIVALGAGWIARVLFFSPGFNAPAQRMEATADDAAESAATRGESALVPTAPGAAEQPAGGAVDQDAAREASAEAADRQGFSAIEEMRAPDAQQAQPRGAPPDADAPAAALLRRATDSIARARVAAARDSAVGEQRADERVVAVAAPPPPMPAEMPVAEKSAPGLGAVAGRIIDASTRQPVVGAQVGVAGTNLGALTNREGNYVIRDVPPGRRDVRAALIGYAEVSLPVTVEADTSVTANLAVRPAAVALESTGAAPAPGAGGIAAADAEWQGTSVAAASALGTVVRGVPDAPVELVWIGRSTAPWRARVVQRIDGAAVEIVEWRALGAAVAGTDGTLPDGRSYVFTTSGGAMIRLRAELPLATLRVLAGQVGPLQ